LVRVRVTSSRTGAVAISQPNLSTISGSIHANEIAEFPRTGDIAVTPDLTKLVLVFAPANQEISPKEPAARRFVMEEAAKAKQTVSRPVTLEIPIRQRKP
jgi:hypothetical protein